MSGRIGVRAITAAPPVPRASRTQDTTRSTPRTVVSCWLAIRCARYAGSGRLRRLATLYLWSRADPIGYRTYVQNAATAVRLTVANYDADPTSGRC